MKGRLRFGLGCPANYFQLVIQRPDALFQQPDQSFFHGRYLCRWVALPNGDLTHHLKGMNGTIGLGGVAGEFPVGQVGIIFNRPGRFYQVDPFRPFALGQLGAPDGGIQRGRQENIPGGLPLPKIGIIACLDPVADLQVGPGAVEISLLERRMGCARGRCVVMHGRFLFGSSDGWWLSSAPWLFPGRCGWSRSLLL